MKSWLTQINPWPSRVPKGFPCKSLCGHATYKQGWVEPRRAIYDHELIIIESGRFEIEIEGSVYECGPHSYVIIPPGQWHTTHCRRTGKRYYLHYDWELWPPTKRTPVMTFHPAKPHCENLRPAPKFVPAEIQLGKLRNPANLLSLMDRIEFLLLHPHPHEHHAARGVLLEVLIRLLDAESEVIPTVSHAEALANRTRLTLDAMAGMPGEAHSVCDALGKMGYSYEHLARIFRQNYGITPVAYLQGVRIERAKSLLRHGNQKVASVAQEVGYQDAIYFSRLFKRQTGTPPAQYRRQQLESK